MSNTQWDSILIDGETVEITMPVGLAHLIADAIHDYAYEYSTFEEQDALLNFSDALSLTLRSVDDD